jgi:hypothetical protein
MKLDEIVNEDFMSYNPSQSFQTAAGGYIATPRYGQSSYLWIDKTTQKEFEIDTMTKIIDTGSDGWKPEEELSYVAKNKLATLVTAGILDFEGDRYYITSLGRKWLHDFKTGYVDDITKSYQMVKGGITGISK